MRASSCGVTCAFLARYTHHTPSVSLHTTQAKSLEEFTFILPITKSHARRAGSTHGLSSCNCMLTVCRIEDALRRTRRLIHALRERSPSLATWTQAWAATRRRVSRHTIQREELHRKNGTPFKQKQSKNRFLLLSTPTAPPGVLRSWPKNTDGTRRTAIGYSLDICVHVRDAGRDVPSTGGGRACPCS